MRALVINVNMIEEVAHAHAKTHLLVVLVITWARSRAEAVERHLLVAYPVIDIRDMILSSNNKNIAIKAIFLFRNSCQRSLLMSGFTITNQIFFQI